MKFNSFKIWISALLLGAFFTHTAAPVMAARQQDTIDIQVKHQFVGAAEVTVRYLDAQTGAQLLPDSTYAVNFGEDKTVMAPEVPGYTAPEPGEHAFTELMGDASWDFYYEPFGEISDTVQVYGRHIFADGENAYSTRPEYVSVKLYQNGAFFEQTTIPSGGDGRYQFVGLPRFDGGGEPYRYTVDEELLLGYSKVVVGFTVTQILQQKTVHLLCVDSETAETIYENWYLYDYGQKVEIEAPELEGYDYSGKTSKTIAALTDDTDITLVYEQNGEAIFKRQEKAASAETAEVMGGVGGQERVVPTAVEVYLKQDGVLVDTKMVREEESWQTVFANWPKYRADGTAHGYDIAVQSVRGFYTHTALKDADGSGNLLAETTSRRMSSPNIAVFVQWEGGDADDRPETVQIQLWQGDAAFQKAAVTAAGDWKYWFSDVPSHSDSGEAYSYRLSVEVAPSGYKIYVRGSAEEGFVVKLTHLSVIEMNPSTGGEVPYAVRWVTLVALAGVTVFWNKSIKRKMH